MKYKCRQYPLKYRYPVLPSVPVNWVYHSWALDHALVVLQRPQIGEASPLKLDTLTEGERPHADRGVERALLSLSQEGRHCYETASPSRSRWECSQAHAFSGKSCPKCINKCRRPSPALPQPASTHQRGAP